MFCINIKAFRIVNFFFCWKERKIEAGKMLVANSFDLWQKDTFFSAAEEVQQSADMQFVSALGDQISHVEVVLKESFNVEEKKSLRWVNLDKENCEDFALFLSGIPGTSIEDEREKVEEATRTAYIQKNYLEKCSSFGLDVASRTHISNLGKELEVVTSSESSSCLMELEKRNLCDIGDEILVEADKLTCNIRNMKYLDKNSLEIVIDSDDRPQNSLAQATPKKKGSKPSVWRSRCEQDPKAKGSLTQSKIINWVNQRFRGGPRSQRQQLVSPISPANSLRFMLALMLTFFLVVPFLLYSA